MWIKLGAVVILMSSLPVWSQSRRSIIEKGFESYFEKEARTIGVAETFVGSRLDTSLKVLQERGLNSSKLLIEPWTGYFWANVKGGLGFRWQDPAFPQGDWGDAHSFMENSPYTQYPRNQLSPSEKYDLVMSIDPRFTGSLTQAEWALGENEYRRMGSVQPWQGICHGWAPASILLPEPKRDIQVNSPYGPILFKIDDIKALGSSLWANGYYRSVYAGFRCRLSDLPRDDEGRITDPNCFSINPADWHLILAHLIGDLKKPFIIDIDNRSEVWNKPILSYRFEYFDLGNHARKSTNFLSVVKERSRLRNLRFSQYRTPGTVYVVGVTSTIVVAYGAAAGEGRFQRRTLVYTYDLELDRDFNILGGEWRSMSHPDFIWRPEFNSSAENIGPTQDLQIQHVGNKKWKEAALRNNLNRIPLKPFVEWLFKESSNL